MYLTYDNLTKEQQSFLICLQLEGEGFETWEILNGWFEIKEDGLAFCYDTVH